MYDPQKDAYHLLGVAADASQEQVEAAYRQAALTWHPDKSPAPDAAEKFQEILHAAKILRDPQRRRLYDLERNQWRKDQGFRPREPRQKRKERARTHAPLPPPPDWLAPAIKLYFDAAHITLQAPMRAGRISSFLYGCAFMAAAGALVRSDLRLMALALICFAAGRVVKKPPHEGILSWAKLIPSQRIAEFHLLDQRAAKYERVTIPYQVLRVAVNGNHTSYRIEILGFPRAAVPVLYRTGSKAEAERLAREAADYFSLPVAA
ncbi:MAG: J domain-containing protein [Planctomycetota bacterium]